MNRRFCVSAASLFALSACGVSKTPTINPTTPPTTTVQVTLANIQKQAVAVYKALGGFVSGAEATWPSASKQIASAYSALGGAVSALADLATGASPVKSIEEVISLVSTVIGLLPLGMLPASTMAAITVSLTLLNALVAGIGSIVYTMPTSAASATLSKTNIIVSAPIPIPLS